jgi:hypothetical protein
LALVGFRVGNVGAPRVCVKSVLEKGKGVGAITISLRVGELITVFIALKWSLEVIRGRKNAFIRSITGNLVSKCGMGIFLESISSIPFLIAGNMWYYKWKSWRSKFTTRHRDLGILCREEDKN